MTPRAIHAFNQRRAAAVSQRAAFAKVDIHEAAHAVIGVHLGLSVAGLRTGLPVSGPHPYGRCRFGESPLATLCLADEMTMAMAGGEADAKFSGRDTTSGDDLQTMIDPALRACRGDPQAAYEMVTAARRRAAGLVERFWPEIRALADALGSAGELSAAQVAPFLSGIPKASPDYARTDAPRPAPVRSRPAEPAQPPSAPGDLITRGADFTPRVVLEVRAYGQMMGDVIEVARGQFRARRDRKFIGGAFTDARTAARVL